MENPGETQSPAQQGEDPLFCSVGNVLNFLAERYEEGLGYNSVGAARSAVNPLVSLEGEGGLSKHPLVARPVKGGFHLTPHLAQYLEFWDIGMVTTYVRGLGANERMPGERDSRSPNENNHFLYQCCQRFLGPKLQCGRNSNALEISSYLINHILILNCYSQKPVMGKWTETRVGHIIFHL